MESFSMNNFLVWVCFNFRLADKYIYVIVKITKFETDYNKSIN